MGAYQIRPDPSRPDPRFPVSVAGRFSRNVVYTPRRTIRAAPEGRLEPQTRRRPWSSARSANRTGRKPKTDRTRRLERMETLRPCQNASAAPVVVRPFVSSVETDERTTTDDRAERCAAAAGQLRAWDWMESPGMPLDRLLGPDLDRTELAIEVVRRAGERGPVLKPAALFCRAWLQRWTPAPTREEIEALRARKAQERAKAEAARACRAAVRETAAREGQAAGVLARLPAPLRREIEARARETAAAWTPAHFRALLALPAHHPDRQRADTRLAGDRERVREAVLTRLALERRSEAIPDEV